MIHIRITNREDLSLGKYLQEIGKISLITTEEEISLAQRIKQGDQIASKKLTNANLRFVITIAKKYQNIGLSLPDLINEGNLGLTKATQRFDETKGVRFASYAYWWIRQAITRALADQSRTIRVPVHMVETIAKYKQVFRRLSQDLGRDPLPEEIANEMGVDVDKIYTIEKIDQYSVKNSCG